MLLQQIQCRTTVGRYSRCTYSCAIDAAPSESTKSQILLFLSLWWSHYSSSQLCFGCYLWAPYKWDVVLHEIIAALVSSSWFYLTLQPLQTGLPVWWGGANGMFSHEWKADIVHDRGHGGHQYFSLAFLKNVNLQDVWYRKQSRLKRF